MKRLIFSIFLIIIGSPFPPNVRAQTALESGLFVIEQISIVNNSKTRAGVIYENLPYAVGDTLSEDAIHAGIERLQSMQFFNRITLQPRAGSEPGKLRLIIDVKERYLPALRFKGGYSEISGWYITPLSLNMDNMFGRGNFLSLNLTYGDRVISLSLDHVNPNIFNSELDLHFRFFIRNHEFLHYIDDRKYKQNVPQAGYFLGFRSRNKVFRNFLFGLDYYVTTADSFFTDAGSKEKYEDLPQEIARYSYKPQDISAFSIYYDLDRRDQALYPCRGWWIGVWFSQAYLRGDSSSSFSRLVLDVRKYQHLSNHFVLAARVKLGGISEKAPFYEKCYLGGPNSLRGYDDRSIGPAGGGEQLAQAALELRFPITTKRFPNHFLTGVLFIDSGANTLAGEKFNEETIKASYGFGFRFRLPFIKLLRMDFAYPIKGGEGMVQFSLGHTF
ncbi:BamA/TamA family outer membrane protein [candidate division KSB1 bacterium]|nr:BamA/TamA family outer membrane protein [candidate division KSB1 bacterium]